MSSEAEIHGTLGALKEATENTKRTLEHLMRMWETQEKNASEGRRVLHEKVDAMKDSVVALGNRVGSVETRLTEIKPAVEEFESQREQQKGAMKLGKVLWTGMLAASGGMGGAIGWWFSHLFGSVPLPPPGH